MSGNADALMGLIPDADWVQGAMQMHLSPILGTETARAFAYPVVRALYYAATGINPRTREARSKQQDKPNLLPLLSADEYAHLGRVLEAFFRDCDATR